MKSVKDYTDQMHNSLGYEPGNCRWATRKSQNRNSSQNLSILHLGETRCLAEWCEQLGLDYLKTYYRVVKCNWTLQEVLDHGSCIHQKK